MQSIMGLGVANLKKVSSLSNDQYQTTGQDLFSQILSVQLQINKSMDLLFSDSDDDEDSGSNSNNSISSLLNTGNQSSTLTGSPLASLLGSSDSSSSLSTFNTLSSFTSSLSVTNLKYFQTLSENCTLVGKDVVYVDSAGNQQEGTISKLVMDSSGNPTFLIGETTILVTQVKEVIS